MATSRGGGGGGSCGRVVVDGVGLSRGWGGGEGDDVMDGCWNGGIVGGFW